MNKDQMKNNVGKRVLLLPPARRFKADGTVRTPVADDWWIIEDVSATGVKISDPATGHVRVLGYDHIYKFTSDQPRDGFERGFLTLHVQIVVKGNTVEVIPNARPGEAVVEPPVIDKVVEFQYPERSGLQQRLERAGYRLHWSRADLAPTRMDAEGWSEVIERDGQGQRTRFRTRDGMILLKRQN
jgi:hypothetical protein